MNDKIRQYPTVLQAIHLLVLYIFIQTVIDFPLAIIDYYKDSEWLYHPLKKIFLGIGSVVFILWYGWRRTGNPVKAVFPVGRFNPLLFAGLLLFFLGAHHLLNYVNAWVEWAVPPPPWFWELFDKIFENDYGFWGAFLKVVIIAPITEELIFRGVVMHGLMRNYSRITAVFFSGLLFALFHLNPWQFPATFILGIVLGWLMIRTNNILLCIGGHALNNLLVLISITYPKQMLEAPASWFSQGTLIWISAGLIIMSLGFLHFLSRRRKVVVSEALE